MAEKARSAPVNYIDETAWYQQGVLAWLWVMVNTTVALFNVQASRSQAAFEALVEYWAGIVVSDGYKVYQHWGHRRQACPAHLIRRARGLAERVSAAKLVHSGYQSILFAIFTRAFSMSEGLMPEDRRLTRFFELVNLERGLIIALAALLIGLALLLAAMNQWRLVDFGHLDYARTMRLVVSGVMLTALGFQTVLSGFFMSILGMRRYESHR
jgi:F0F1-type ATP synthase membrane subunit c/vacuolar-type H+-ATPase subunit K